MKVAFKLANKNYFSQNYFTSARAWTNTSQRVSGLPRYSTNLFIAMSVNNHLIIMDYSHFLIEIIIVTLAQ